ncbi:hypothetical protein B0T21DRAFT_409021 [Apiosordaria backusii]|uniref:Uncharacterized protein n=1 Tax=Apiosordaria backusii TaxID=314023 RepID=A0AA40K170_9PEZI|nr:hypothetical protein B0T21DRAFT_409021 [Apiosordaria backusii]
MGSSTYGYGYGYSVYDMDGSPQAVTELDLSACHPNSIVDRINAMPALKTSTAFFTFLRANLVLPHSAMSSNPSTPNLAPTRPLPPTTTIMRRSPTPQSSRPVTPVPGPLEDDEIPPLTLEVLTTKADKTSALKLIADSIAQQRQTASSHIIFHPLPLSSLIAVLAVTYHFFLSSSSSSSSSDLGTCLMTLSSIITTYLLTIRYLTSPFIRLAESISYPFLFSSFSSSSSTNPEEEDLVIGCRYGNEIIGATVLHISRPIGWSSDPNPKRHKQRGSLSSFKGGKGVIRAWTVKLRGGEEEKMVLPEWLNRGWLRRSERRAAGALERVVGEFGNGKRR